MHEKYDFKQEWLDTLTAFSSEFHFPDEARLSLADDLNKVLACPETWNIFCRYDAEYDKNIHMDYELLIKELEQQASLCGIHTYTLNLLFFIGLCRKTKELYMERDIPVSIFHDSMMDLQYKLLECHKLYQVWGYAPASWITWWFELRRFTLGRLQFEMIPFPYTYEEDGISLNPGDTVINVHIPSSGPLRKPDCEASYQKAAEFFKNHFPKGPILFYCESWLLFPPHRQILAPGSHILEFMSNYRVFKTVYTNGDLWRIFYQDSEKTPQELPQNTGLQRAYRDWLLKGNMAGMGYGIYTYKPSK